jgi:hypothetical protein
MASEYTPDVCQDCNGRGWRTMTPYQSMLLGQAWQTDRTRRMGGMGVACEPCRWCDGQGRLDIPKGPPRQDGSPSWPFDWAYPIGWALEAGKVAQRPVRGIVWSYAGPGLCGRPHGINSTGRAFLDALEAAGRPDLAYRAGGL